MKISNYLFIAMLLLASSFAWSQTRTIKGKITDAATNEPVAGVTVLEKGTQNGVTADSAGHYSITVKSQPVSLVFSLLGYEKREIKITRDSVLNVLMTMSMKSINEVVVVAYGEATRKDLTSAVTTVDAKQIENIPMVSIDQVLQGQVAGLQVSTYSGQPGGEVQVRLRGVGSITAGSQPLYVVDGIPINSGNISSGITWTSNSLAGINANDIENVTVLKDAAATAIYGSRGANGVIVITTKKGKAGKTKIRFDSEYGFNKIILNDKTRPLNSDEYYELTHEGLINAGYTESAAQTRLKQLGSQRGANTNWLDEVTRTSQQMMYNLSASGGTDQTQFYVSGGYFKQEGTTLGSGFERATGSLSLNQKASQKLNFQTNISIGATNQHTPFQSGYFRAPIIAGYFLTPWQRPYDANGAINLSTTEFTDIYNPLAIDSLDQNYLRNLKIIGALGFDYEIIKGLKFITKASLDYNNTNEFIYANPFYGDGVGFGGWADQSNTGVFNWVWTNLFDYHKDFTKQKLIFNIKAGVEAQKSKLNRVYAEGMQFPPTSSINVLSAAADPSYVSSSISDYAFFSNLSEASLTWQSKYTLTGTYRRDGSSRFGINNRYGNFYSIGSSWQLDQEAFMKNVKVLSTLRLRTSYGQIGNADIGNYTWQPLYAYGSNYLGEVGSAPDQPGNYNLTWEKNNPFNIGVDAGILNDRITFIVDLYHRKTTDMLLNVPISKTTGFSTTLVNVGEMVNKGIEFTVGADAIRSKNWYWHIDFNIAHNQNEITKLYAGQQIVILPYIYEEGSSYHSFYTRHWAGVDPQTGAGMWYTDSTLTETTKNINEVKRSKAGCAEPKVFGGLVSQLSYKQFSLSMQFYYVFGNQIYDGWGFYLQSDGAYYQYNQTLTAMDRWQHPGDITDVPKYVYGNNTSSNYGSTRFLYDGDYIRLRDITFTYTLSDKITSRLKLGSFRVYVKGTNMYTWIKDKRVSFDPDLIDGVSDLNLPNTKTFVGGLSVEF